MSPLFFCGIAFVLLFFKLDLGSDPARSRSSAWLGRKSRLGFSMPRWTWNARKLFRLEEPSCFRLTSLWCGSISGFGSWWGVYIVRFSSFGEKNRFGNDNLIKLRLLTFASLYVLLLLFYFWDDLQKSFLLGVKFGSSWPDLVELSCSLKLFFFFQYFWLLLRLVALLLSTNFHN